MKLISNYIALVLNTTILLSCSNLKEEKFFFKNPNLEKKIKFVLMETFKEQSNAKYGIVYFTTSEKGEDYVFIYDEIGTFNYVSSYYFDMNGKKIIIGFKNNYLQKKYANSEKKKKEVIFNDSRNPNLYSNKMVILKIINTDKFKIIEKPSEDLLYLNDYYKVQPLPEPPINK